MGYVVFSRFQTDQDTVRWNKCFTHKKYNKCVTYCEDKKAAGCLSDFYIYQEGECPVGYLISRGKIKNSKPLFHC